MSTFRFKKFSVHNEKSAMKVNTDSVLLGAWAIIPSIAKYGLDIGSGTGLLALMTAQRHSTINLTGIEIEKNAFEESEVNFKHSPWSKRLTAINSSLQNFKSTQKFDFIISNPPYFIDDLKNSKFEKTQARHTDSLSFEDLLYFAKNYLSEKGVFNLILPKKESDLFISISENYSLHLHKISFIKPNPDKEVNRVLMSFGRKKKKIEKDTFCVYQSQGVYSKKHHQLTKNFYLDKFAS